MTTQTKYEEALKVALDLATMHHTDDGYAELRSKVRQLAKEALAQPEQRSVSEHLEPVAWKVSPRYEDCDGYFDFTETEETALTLERRGWSIQPLYTTPPQRTAAVGEDTRRAWVGLTDVEWMNIVNKDQAWFGQRPDEVAHEVAKLVEAKLKEKNT